MTAEIGRVLGGRYRLVAPIGMGASAQVYLADDVRLRRRVALKMLHDALAGDAEFLRRFRAEARAAAALSHPNVMAVYDWGDDDTAFIVTEYLGGGSLRSLLDGGQTLSPSQALGIGLEATRALDYAHRRGFVHRDIKPANLLFGEEQRLRIADFGLARALAEAAWTEPQGAMLGTARYASPEQAKGEKLNGKADVYALALVLVEAVTGEVPFAADTTLGTLMARVDKQLEVPDELGPLQAILTRAGHPDPEQRIDARTLAAGLLRAAKALPKPAPLPLAGALSAAGELAVDRDPTVHAPLVGTEPEPEPDLTAEDLDLDPPDWVNQAEPSAGVAAGVVAGAGAGALLAGVPDAADPDPSDDDPSADGDPTGESPAVAGDADAEGAPDLDADTDPVDPDAPVEAGSAVDPEPARVAVPLVDLRDRADEADPHDAPAGPTEPAWSDQDPADDTDDEPVDTVVLPADEQALVGAAIAASAAADPTVVSSRPPTPSDGGDDAAAHVAGGGLGDDGDAAPHRRRRWPWVVLVVLILAGAGGGVAVASMGDDEPAPPARTVVLPVPELVGRSQDTAEAVADAGGWTTTVTEERRDGTLRGQVLGTTPAAGARLAPGETIELLVSAGQTEVDVPSDLRGRSVADATAALEAVGLQASTSGTRFDEEVDEGAVLELAEGTPPRLEKGSTVGLVTSDGPEPRTVPSGLVGNTRAGATEALQALGLEVAVNEQFNDDVPEGEVVSQSPAPGETVERGSTVTLEVSRGPELVAVPDVSGADTPAEAAAIIRAAGLVPGSVSGSSEGTPAGTSPGTGTQVRKGSTVNIVLG